MVDFRCVDLSEKLALFHAGPNVDVPLLHITAGARVNRSRHVGFYVAGQHNLVRRCGTLWSNDVDHGHGHGSSLGSYCGARPNTRENAEPKIPATARKTITAASQPR